MKKVFQCSKCGEKKYEVDEIRTTGAGFTKYFNIQNRKFSAISCSSCGFTELYRGGRSGGASSIIDFLTN